MKPEWKVTGRMGIGNARIIIKNLTKSYGHRTVLSNISLELSGSRIYCLMGPSGSGKTTFFRLLLGLEQPDFGTIQMPDRLRTSAVFQEDRLCEDFTPMENILMVLSGPPSRSREMARRELVRLLPEESITRAVSTLSGGMKRRACICRALVPDSDMVLMDEPFTGLDMETKKKAAAYICEKSMGRLVIISTHQEEDIGLLRGVPIRLCNS